MANEDRGLRASTKRLVPYVLEEPEDLRRSDVDIHLICPGFDKGALDVEGVVEVWGGIANERFMDCECLFAVVLANCDMNHGNICSSEQVSTRTPKWIEELHPRQVWSFAFESFS